MASYAKHRRYRRRRRRIRLWVWVVLILLIAAIIALSFHACKPDDSTTLSSVAPVSTSSEEPTNVIPQSQLQMPDWVNVDILPINDFSRPGDPLEAVRDIVVHYTGNPGTTAEQNRNYYEELITLQNRSVSSHFVIGMDGTIIQCVPLDEIAYATSYRNADTISIECCHATEDGAFTDATYNALVKLVQWLCDTYDLDAGHVIRHYDATEKECPRYFVRNPEAWVQFLRDLKRGEVPDLED